MKKRRVITVGQGLRHEVKKCLSAKFKVRDLGYDDSSTSWSFVITTNQTPGKIQNMIWGYPGLSSIWCSVK